MASRVWEQWYPAGVTWDLPLPPATPLESLLKETAQRLPDASTTAHSHIESYTSSPRKPPKDCSCLAWALASMSVCICQIRHTSLFASSQR